MSVSWSPDLHTTITIFTKTNLITITIYNSNKSNQNQHKKKKHKKEKTHTRESEIDNLQLDADCLETYKVHAKDSWIISNTNTNTVTKCVDYFETNRRLITKIFLMA